MDKSASSSQRLDEALSAIADQAPVSWDVLEREMADTVRLDKLHLVDDVARAFREYRCADVGAVKPAAVELFAWNGLSVRDRIGSGSYGEVFRAFDPWLEREVALKLFARDAGAGLDEARRLARVRQHNVLAVYGCGIAAGRAGLWSELIDGRTLADLIASDGPLSVEETLRIGHDLARALCAVHAAGLVHGDIKAENVMRERGGRIVLMDFGAGGEQRLMAGKRLYVGTLRYLPPEVLDGAPLSRTSDVYALGVLLYFLRCGALPWPQTEIAALRAAQDRGVRLAPNGPTGELDARFAALVERCLASDPAQRPGDATTLATQLADIAYAAPRSAPRRRMLGIALALALTGAVLTGWWIHTAAPPWQSDANFLRLSTSGSETLAADATVKVGDRLRLHLSSNRDAYVYVLNEDADGVATVLFPLPGLANPVSAAMALDLPGGSGSSLAWEVSADSAHEEFLVLASLQPLPEIDAEVQRWQTARQAQRSVGRLVTADAAPSVSGTHLRALLARLDQSDDANQVRRWRYGFSHVR